MTHVLTKAQWKNWLNNSAVMRAFFKARIKLLEFEMKKNNLKFKQIVGTIAVPIAVWLIMETVDLSVSGVHLIGNMVDIKNLLRALITSFCFALAINSNLTLGRMDLSLGSQMYLGVIFGGNIALSMNLGGIGVLIFSIVFGALGGFLVGVLFVKLRILPMVLGLGMTLIYETLSFSSYNQQGLMLFGKPNVGVLSNVGFIAVIAVIVGVAVTYLFQYSIFGYRRRAIRGSQRLASDSGINIYRNCVKCYILAGGLAGIAGVFSTAYLGTLVPVIGMSSNSSVFVNIFPMVLGMWIGSYARNPVVGVFAGALSLQFLTIGLSKLGMDPAYQTIIRYLLWLVFSVYNLNAWRFEYAKKRKLRQEEARKMRFALAQQ